MLQFHLLRLAKLLQIFQNERAVCSDAPQRRASFHLRAVRAGIQSFFPDAVMYGAELVAERCFGVLYATARAVDHLRCDRYAVELRPQRGGFLAQGIVVRDRCDSGIAGFAVQSAAADQLVCIFHSYLHNLL